MYVVGWRSVSTLTIRGEQREQVKALVVVCVCALTERPPLIGGTNRRRPNDGSEQLQVLVTRQANEGPFDGRRGCSCFLNPPAALLKALGAAGAKDATTWPVGHQVRAVPALKCAFRCHCSWLGCTNGPTLQSLLSVPNRY